MRCEKKRESKVAFEKIEMKRYIKMIYGIMDASSLHLRFHGNDGNFIIGYTILMIFKSHFNLKTMHLSSATPELHGATLVNKTIIYTLQLSDMEIHKYEERNTPIRKLFNTSAILEHIFEETFFDYSLQNYPKWNSFLCSYLPNNVLYGIFSILIIFKRFEDWMNTFDLIGMDWKYLK